MSFLTRESNAQYFLQFLFYKHLHAEQIHVGNI